jgi:2'-5' RNA ligase|nr:RNA 2',3'-cyclic phosphodiesterase [Kofleriaceae bacterium]
MPSEPNLHLFVGVRIAANAANALSGAAETLARRARDAGLDPRWVAPPNYHVTVKYLGWTRADAVGAIGDALARAVAGTQRFDMRVARLGAFASLDKATVVWAGIEDPAPISALAAKVDAAMTGVGFAAETRPFVPHVTVARLKVPSAVKDVLLPLAEQMFGGGPIEHVILYESQTKPSGSVYKEIRRIAFKTALEGPKPTFERQIDAVDLGATEDTDDGWPRGHSS